MMMKRTYERCLVKSSWEKALAMAVTLTVALVMLSAITARAADLKASLAKMPVYAESTDKGVLVDLVKAIAKTSGKNIEIQVVPFNRSIRDVIEGKADFHMPLIKNDIIDLNKVEYTYAKPVLWHVNFVLYTNKNKPIDKSKLKDYKIETDLAHVSYFDFPIKGSTRIDSSLKKVNAGRIDGFIFADFAADPIIKKDGLNNVHRELYKVFDSDIVLPKGEKGQATDVFLTETIEKMRADGSFDKIMSPIDQPYDDWQP
jgi:polar amino acid transport system substrate-binding protein